MLTFIILIFICILSTIESKTFEQLIRTKNGLIRGKTVYVNKTQINVFKGIPYAVPPIGDLRFRRPVPMSQWAGVYDATEFGAQCMQMNGSLVDDRSQSENCLFLNIWAPVVSHSTGKLPVMVYIHGGGLETLSSSYEVKGVHVYDGTVLAQRGRVVTVSINYRLGVFGYLFGSCADAPGNMGYWDQAMALKWIVHNIGAFDGNEDDITVFGQSAGGWSTSVHMVSPISRHLFQKAIVMSGSSYQKYYLTDRSSAYKYSKEFAMNSRYFDENYCKSEENFINCLKNKTAFKLNLAQIRLGQNSKNLINHFRPVFGDQFLPRTLIDAIDSGDFNRNIKLMTGHVELEGVSVLLDSELDKGLEGFPQYPPIVLGQQINDRYNPNKTYVYNISKEIVEKDIQNIFLVIDNQRLRQYIADKYLDPFPDRQYLTVDQQIGLREAVMHAFGDYGLTCATVLTGANMVRNIQFKGQVFQYRLSYANSKSRIYGSQWAFASHDDDIPLVFGQPLVETDWTSADRYMSELMVKIWTHFAKYGFPPPLNGKQWPEYTVLSDGSANASYFDLTPKPEVVVNSYKGNDGYVPNVINNCIDFWEQIFRNEYKYT